MAHVSSLEVHVAKAQSITDIFETEMAKENQWIIIDKVVEIIPPEGADTGGGLAPGVSEWEQIEGSITI